MEQLHLANQAKKERERQAQVEAQARKKHLNDIVPRNNAIWKQVSTWIEKRTPKGYERATDLLVDLRDAAAVRITPTSSASNFGLSAIATLLNRA